MRITKLFGIIAATLVSIAPVGVSAQKSAAKRPARTVIARSDVRELPADQQIIQASNRLTFGARPGDILNVRAIGLDQWIDQQLHPDKIDDDALNSFLANYSALNQDQNSLLSQYAEQQRARRQVRQQRADSTRAMTATDSIALRQQQQQQFNLTRQVVTQLQSSRVARAVASNRQLQEVMTDFWENHFNIYAQKGGPEVYYLADFDQKVIRPNALGKFRDLLEAVAQSPAMLFYLDNAQSMADSNRPTLRAPNQVPRVRVVPFGRGGLATIMGTMREQQQQERQQQRQRKRPGLNENYGRELLELHTLGVDGGYTQQDVINVARALTGWTVDDPRAGGGFVFRPAMHDASPKLVLGHQLPGGRGIADGEEVLDIVARHPSTARFIARKLVRHLVSDSVPTSLVDRAAAAFTRTDGDIRQVLATIVTSPEFYSRAAYRAKVKTPFELVVSTMRAMDQLPDTTPRTAQLPSRLGQPVFGRLTPDGWPDDAQEWINSGAILNRINFGTIAANGGLPGVTIDRWPPAASLRTAPFGEQVDGVIGELLGGEVSPETRSILLSGVNPLAGAMPASNTADANAPRRLKDLIGLTLGAPEFQRR